MQIEEGKSYRTASGDKWTNARPYDRYNDPKGWAAAGAHWVLNDSEGRVYPFRDNGIFAVPNPSDKNDLIAEWTDEPAGPVRTRTVTEIVPGGYNGVQVDTYDDTRVRIGMQHTIMDAAYLRAAAAVFVQLADALESDGK